MKFRMITIFVMVLLSVVLISAGILFAFSRGYPEQFTGAGGEIVPGSMSEKVFIEIGGTRQGMFIQSRDTSNPVLLYIHGGMPDYFLSRKFPTGLEDIFTVIWWEQRGSGISYDRKMKNDPVTSDILVNDALELTRFLCKKFGKDKIYLMGHSGGTFIGIQAIAQAPELFHAYIGVAQIADQLKSEKMAYEYMVDKYKIKKDKPWIRKLNKAVVSDSIPRNYLLIRDKAMHRLGVGTMRNMNSVITGIFFSSLLCRDYSFGEKIRMWEGKARSGVSSVWAEMISTNLNNKVPEVEIPVYFFSGIHDYTVNYSLAKEYFNNLQARLKAFYTFKNSAHSPLFEEPVKMIQIIREDVLNGTDKMEDI